MFDLSMCLILSFECNIHLCVDQYQKYFETRVKYILEKFLLFYSISFLRDTYLFSPLLCNHVALKDVSENGSKILKSVLRGSFLVWINIFSNEKFDTHWS